MVDFKNIKDAGKKLNNVFKDWFIQVKTPESMLPAICQNLNYPIELQNDAIEIAKKIKSEIEGCQPITIVGVALYTLNQRLHLLDPQF
jgi:transcription initiation factor TFIIIB Brf1 subunit/transcription initiation factor TFIIB|tara:strand:+ start:48 stop:311 length:264 start_codon:yes stop_codon:yes gene_type:complete